MQTATKAKLSIIIKKELETRVLPGLKDQRGLQNMFSTPSAQTKAKSPDYRSSHQLESALKEVHTSAEDAVPVAERLPGRSKALGSIPRAKIKKKKGSTSFPKKDGLQLLI